MEYEKYIEIYGKAVEDFEVSPFESVDMLHKRSRLERDIYQLTQDQRIKLFSYDLKLIKNAKKMSEHIAEVYDFTLSKEPLSEWWWHLDKVANGELNLI